MKKRLYSWMLLLAMLVGVFGCTGGTADGEGTADVTGDTTVADTTEETTAFEEEEIPLPEDPNRPANLLNFAELDADGKPKFQIVYSSNASVLMREECERLSDEIRKITGVSLPIVSSIEKQKTHEILVGDVSRSDTIDVMDSYRLKEQNFVIVAIGTRVAVYAKNEQATLTGLALLGQLLSYQSEARMEYGVASDINYLYEPNENPPVSILGEDGKHVEFALQNSETIFTYARLSFTGNAGWRLQTKYTKDGAYDDFGAAQRLARSLNETDPSVIEEISVSQAGNIYTLTAADGSRAEMNTESFRIDFYTPSGKLAASITNLSSYAGGSSVKGVLQEDEALFGTGERFNSTNQRGKVIDMYSRDTWSSSSACYMVIPLISSSRGSGLFINRYERMTLDLGREDKNAWKATVEGAPLDVYVYTTEQIEDVIFAYSALTGFASQPEEWTYGMIVCAYWPELSQKWSVQISADGKSEGVYDMIAMMETYDLPWTGVLVEAWGGYSATKHKDLKELCDYVHSLGKKMIVYMQMGTVGASMYANSELSSGFTFLYDESYILHRRLLEAEYDEDRPTEEEEGDVTEEEVISSVPPFSKPISRNYLDVTNPNAVAWFEDYWQYLANDIGVDGCKIDFCEQVSELYEILYYDTTMTTAGSHHWYASAFCSFYGEVISQKPDGGMSYTRGGGIGSQRAPYMWAGDQSRDYTSLAWQLNAVLSSGLSGVPYMSYDMSGYQYGVKAIEQEGQVFLRGAEFTAFTICMQTHGSVRRSYQFAEESEEYRYVTEIYRAYTKLHEHLTPYLTELCEEASTTGMPVMRHLVLGWQDDKNVYGIDNQYMLGDAFLIAPILNKTFARKIYLPEGEWLDLNTGEEYSVGAEGMWLESYAASLAELPSFYNKNTASEIAPTLVDGIMALYDYARSVAPD